MSQLLGKFLNDIFKSVVVRLRPGVSSGQAIAIAQQLAAKELPPGMSYEWTDLTYLEIVAGNTIVYIFPLYVLLVFLTPVFYVVIRKLTTRAQPVNPAIPTTVLPPGLPALPLSDPAALLRRRPDVRVAERELAAATARIGIATADLFPRVTFIGNVGLQATSFEGLGQGGSESWNFDPRITWAALDLGRVRACITAGDARAEAALAAYERTVLRALEETENGLVDFGNEQARQQFLRASAQASQQAADLAHQRYEAGAADFLSMLDAERTLLEAQDRLAASQTHTTTALVAVLKALGGGPPLNTPK